MTKIVAAWLMLTTTTGAPVAPPSPGEPPAGPAGSAIRVTEQAAAKVPAETRPVAGPRGADPRPFADARFDFDEMARRVLSHHWASWSLAERSEIAPLVAGLLERSLVAKAIASVAGTKVRYVGQAVDGDYAVLRARLPGEGRAESTLDYRLRLSDGKWHVYDVLVDGVSFVSTYRSQFHRIISATSFAALRDRLRSSRREP
jgi:phospholipid transport system substrate-binding protein